MTPLFDPRPLLPKRFRSALHQAARSFALVHAQTLRDALAAKRLIDLDWRDFLFDCPPKGRELLSTQSPQQMRTLGELLTLIVERGSLAYPWFDAVSCLQVEQALEEIAFGTAYTFHERKRPGPLRVVGEWSLNSLAERHRVAVEMRFLKRESYTRIAEALDISNQSASNRVRGGLRRVPSWVKGLAKGRVSALIRELDDHGGVLSVSHIEQTTREMRWVLLALHIAGYRDYSVWRGEWLTRHGASETRRLVSDGKHA